MKKSIWILSIAMLLLGGLTSVNAQELKRSSERPEAIAKQKVSDLSQTLDLTGDQQRSLFRALVKHEKAIAQGEKSDLEAIMKKNLSAEQFERWKKTKDN